MPRAKTNLSQPEVRLKRADESWHYRQLHRAEVNEKARLRMQRRRAALKNAPSAVQHEHLMRARKHRQDYRERVKRDGPRLRDKSSNRVNPHLVPLRRSQRCSPSSTSTQSPTPPPFTFSTAAFTISPDTPMSPWSSVDDDSGAECNYDAEDEEEDEDGLGGNDTHRRRWT
ncbi:hypothetical protein R3P38DRAFT_2785214 [Favolaschia claudopus]|uniref:Uncharacterized protein n=1 Tax=Favolaschia claudopus TaxID=2862362 RepID=A0AAW0AW70_9AGAR